MDKSKIVLGAQLYTLRDQMTDKEGAEKCIKAVGEMGYKTVQISAVPVAFQDPEWFKALCDENGLGIVCTHSDLGKMQDDEGLSELVRAHKIFECKDMGIGFMPHVYHNKEGMLEFAGITDKIATKLADEGMNLIYHNHRFEFEKYDGDDTGMDMLMKHSPRLRFLPDIYWVVAGGADPIALFKKMDGRFNLVHYKDMGVRNDAAYICEVCKGNINFADITKYLSSKNIYDYIVEQDTCDGHPLDSLKMSIDYLNGKLFPSL